MNCAICQYSNDDLKTFSTHVRSVHGLSSEQYTIKVFHGGVKPTCLECGAETRYVSFAFKQYCKEHSKIAMSKGGTIGGVAPAWNKGLTSDVDSRLALQSAKMKGEGNHFFGKKHSQDTIRKISQKKTLATSSIEERIIERQREFTLLTPLEEYHSRQQQYLLFKCTTCGEEQPKTLQAFERGSRCYKCHPVGKSNWELQVYDFVKEIASDAVSGDKSVISPKEIDIYVPSKRLGIECHGLYWHSEAARSDDEFDKRKHLSKFQLAQEKGVKLLQLFEDEWRDKRDICESMIRHRLGLDSVRCKTWSTKIVEMTTEEERNFFDRNHIAGYTPSKVSWSLVDRNGIRVAALSVRSPRHQSKYNNHIEVARFALEKDLNVPGGLSKLMAHASKWAKKEGYSSIMTYVDRRIGGGAGYAASGFEKVSETDVDYWYTDNELRYDRFKFRAQDGKPEKLVAAQAKVHKIYGCGSIVFKKEL